MNRPGSKPSQKLRPAKLTASAGFLVPFATAPIRALPSNVIAEKCDPHGEDEIEKGTEYNDNDNLESTPLPPALLSKHTPGFGPHTPIQQRKKNKTPTRSK